MIFLAMRPTVPHLGTTCRWRTARCGLVVGQVWRDRPGDAALSESNEPHEIPSIVRTTWLPEGQLQIEFEPLHPELDSGEMSEQEALTVLAAFAQSFPEASKLEVVPAMASPSGSLVPWEQKLRAEFLKRYGQARMPLPDSLLNGPLFMALRMFPRYMGPGIREAAEQMFRSPIFLASVALSLVGLRVEV
jgi:hypothetical protein